MGSINMGYIWIILNILKYTSRMQIMFMAFIDRVIIAHGKISMDSPSSPLTGHQENQMDPTVVIIVSNII